MRVSGELSVHDMECAAKENVGEGEKETGSKLECLFKTAGPHTELKQEIPASGGRGRLWSSQGELIKKLYWNVTLKSLFVSLRAFLCLCT